MVQSGWVVEVLVGVYIGRDGKLTRSLHRAAMFTSRKVARIASERFGERWGVRTNVRMPVKAERSWRLAAAVAA